MFFLTRICSFEDYAHTFVWRLPALLKPMALLPRLIGLSRCTFLALQGVEAHDLAAFGSVRGELLKRAFRVGKPLFSKCV